jgi:hypothetical protein
MTFESGQTNDFFLTDTLKKWEAVESFLIRLGRPGGDLSLVARDFKFEWSDHFDKTGTYYLYSGRKTGQGSDGVFLFGRGT